MRLKIDFKRFWVAEAITAAGTLAAAGINAAAQARTNAQNREQSEHAFRMQQEAIQRQNEYNSPAQQVLRMKAAGLNPALAYGADGDMTGNQSAVPAYNAIPAESPNVGNLGAGLADAIRTGVEVKDLERRQALAVAEIAAQDFRNFQAVCAGELSQAQAKETLTLLGYRVEELEAGNTLKWENVLKVREEIANLKEERKEILSRVKVNEQQVQTLAATMHLSETQVYAILQRLPHEIEQMDAEAAFAWAQEAVGRANVTKIHREVSHIGFIEWANGRDFDFNKASRVAELEFQRYGFKVGLAKQLMSTIGVITGVAAMRNNQPLPTYQRQPSPIVTPSGGSMFGQNWAQ